MDAPAPIVFYDGDCGLCNRSVRYLLKFRKKNQPIYFAALQSVFAKNFFVHRKEPLPDLSSIVVWTNDRFLYKSNAAIYISRFLRFHSGFRLLHAVPKRLRDGIYDFIAKNRTRFSTTTHCTLPSNQDSILFLD